MNRTEIEAEIALLVEQMETQPQDLHELQLQILAKLNEMRAFGMALPKDLLDLEATLEAEFSHKKRRGEREGP